MIGLYCPDLPPVRGGLPDHTLALARALEALGHGPAVLGRRGEAHRFDPLPCRTGVTPLSVATAARELGVTDLLVQYVPFLFARRGVSPALCRGVASLARLGIGVAVFLHEPFVPFTRLPWLVTGWPMRWQLGFVLRRAQLVYAPVPRFAEIARGCAPRATVRLAPVGATLPTSRVPRAEARAALGLGEAAVAIGVFSPGASAFRGDWIERAAAALAGRTQVVWVCFGYGHERVLSSHPAGVTVVHVADSAPEAVSGTMRALDVAAAPYFDGLTLRRTGAMLALAHGIPLVSSTGHLFDPQMAELAACEPTPEAFAGRLARLVSDPAERALLARRAGLYAAKASVEALARMLVHDLEGGSGR